MMTRAASLVFVMPWVHASSMPGRPSSTTTQAHAVDDRTDVPGVTIGIQALCRRFTLPSVRTTSHDSPLAPGRMRGYTFNMTTNNTKTLSKLCYCQSARHARAAVRALEQAGYAARTDAGYIYADNSTDAAFEVAQAAIKKLGV